MGYQIQVKNIFSRIMQPLPDGIKQALDDSLSYAVEGYFFTSRFNSKRLLALQFKKNKTMDERRELGRLMATQNWDGKKHLFTKQQIFPTGCLKRVKKILQENRIDYDLLDLRVRIPLEKSIDVKTELREYQKLAVEEFLKVGRGILQVSTGGGKTLIFTSVIGKLNVPAIVYVHTCDLLYQAKEVISNELGIECGQIGAGVVDIKKINVATIQSVTRVLSGKYIKYDSEDEDDFTEILDKETLRQVVANAGLMILDECHRAATFSVQLISKNSVNAFYRLFTSASPWRDDGADLLIEAASGPKLVKVSSSYLVKRKYLVPAKIFVYKIPRMAHEDSYQKIYAQCIVNNEYRNNLVIKSALKLYNNKKSFLILVKLIRHGEYLYEQLRRQMKVYFLQGKVDFLERKDVLDAFNEGKLNGLIATSLADEGLNLPRLDAVILAGGGMSSVKALQRVGRTLRPYPGKDKAFVVDFLDLTKYLYKQTNRRLELYKTEPEFEVKIQGRDE